MKFVDDFVEVLLLIRTPTVGFVVAERCNDWSPPPLVIFTPLLFNF
jgi:hypothetical protein